MLAQPSIRYLRDLVHDRSDTLGRDHLELKLVALTTFQGIAQIGPSRAFEGEGGQGHTRLFAELQDFEAGVEIERQARCRYLIEGRSATMAVGKFDETPHELRPFRRRADWVAQGRPGSSARRKHQKAEARIREEEALVAHEREQGVGARLSDSDAPRPIDFLGVRRPGARTGRAEQLPDTEP